MSLQPQPPPKRTVTPSPAPTPSESSGSSTPTWKSKIQSKSSVWGKKALVKGVAWSDSIGGKVNDVAEKRFGTEAFWPVTGDFPKEMDKAARILRAFTVEGIVKEETEIDPDDPAHKKKKTVTVLRKIPSEVIASCLGLAIFTSFRSGFAPLGGAGGAGVVVAKLPDGSWSAPASISPNNFSTGFLIGLDVYDCVLVIRSQAALDSFGTHKVTLGTEIGVTAGPWGAGAAVEAGKEKAPVFSYVKSRGLYAGVELVGQVFVERFEENGNMYHWPGVKARDILSGKVKIPVEAAELQQALKDAESGRAQHLKDSVIPGTIIPDPQDIELQDGEVLHLPPTPDQADGSTQDTRAASQPSVLPPRLPPRSSQSNSFNTEYPNQYSGLVDEPSDISDSFNALEVVPPVPGEIPKEDPPAYIDHSESASTAYPQEKREQSTSEQIAPPPVSQLPVESEMSESEKREWEQHLADQADAARK